jgi:acyl-coenzyme A thioesterase PaaI-like protein
VTSPPNAGGPAVSANDEEGDQRLAFVALTDQIRELQHAVSASRPSAVEARSLAVSLRTITDTLTSLEVPEGERFAGRLHRVAGLGGCLLPIVELSPSGPKELRGVVRFGPFHLGWGGAAHGGVLSLMFDDLLGRFVVREYRRSVRTVSLRMTYRALTPLHTDLHVHAWQASADERRVVIRADLRDGDKILAEAEADYALPR